MKLNKYKTQETICYSFISMWVIGIILLMVTSSCSTLQQANEGKTLDKKTGIYHQKNTYEPWSIK
jgi:hypothetical protein